MANPVAALKRSQPAKTSVTKLHPRQKDRITDQTWHVNTSKGRAVFGGRGKLGGNPRAGLTYRLGLTADGQVVHIYDDGQRIVMHKPGTPKPSKKAAQTGGYAYPG